MEYNKDIALLIKKLLDDNISSKELQILLHYFRSAEIQGDVDSWLNNVWSASSLDQVTPVDAKTILTQINHKLRHIKRTEHPNRVSNISRSLMKYAALIVITMAVSWFLFHEASPDPQFYTTLPGGVNEISVLYGSKSRLVLPDSSVVYLNSGSTLRYPAEFTNERIVHLQGEAFFEVHADSLHPFYVNTPDITVKALGTAFNVKSYPEEQTTETTLISGSVEILKKKISGQEEKQIVDLLPNQKATYSKAQPNVVLNSLNSQQNKPQVIIQEQANTEIATSWKTNQLVFDAESFEQIAVKLERWYNVEIDIQNNRLKKMKITGRYDTETIEQVLHSIRLTESFNYAMKKNQIIIN